ncbi:MAG TPA: hypothetical protein PLQ76_04395, partial [bacterium]|nr:hypothetical protein [bacterium]
MNRPLQYVASVVMIAVLAGLMLLPAAPVRRPCRIHGDAPLFYNPRHSAMNPYRKVGWLNGEWEMQVPWESDWRKAVVPHYWNVVPGLENYVGQVKYKLRFRAPRDWRKTENPRVSLNFNGIAGAFTVTLNGRVTPRYSNRFLPFSIDVTDWINLRGENLLEVLVDNTTAGEAAGWKYDEKNFGGIYREAYLEMRGAASFEGGVVSAEPDGGGGAEVTVRASALLP